MTGDTAFLGEQVKSVLDYYQEKKNAEGGVGGRPIEFIYEDDQGTTAGAASAARKLIEVDGVSALIGPLFASTVMGMKDIAIEAEIPTMIPTTSHGDIFGEGHDGNYLFTLAAHPETTSRSEVKYWTEVLGATKIALFSQQSDQTTTKYEYFHEFVPEAGAEIVHESTYSVGTDDFRSALTAIKASGAEVVFFNGDRAELVKFARQMNELGIDDLFISGDDQAIQDDVFAEIGELVDGHFGYTIAGVAGDDESKALYAAFEEDYKAKSGTEQVEAYIAIVYDCAEILTQAMEESGAITGKDLRDTIANVKNFVGVTGTTTIKDNGLSNRSCAYNVYENGEIVVAQLYNAE